MTRLAILSDVHGNLPALEAVIDDMAQFQPDHVIVAGDLVNIGPFSAQVMQRIDDLRWATIRGNHEYYLLEHDTNRAPESRRTWVTLPLLFNQLKGRWYNHIAAMPDERTLYYPDAPPIRVMHGTPGNPFHAVTRNSSEDEVRRLLTGIEEPTVISGHYHLSFEHRVAGWHILNPGSLGVPLDGLQDANYMILDSHGGGWEATFCRVPVDYAPLFAEFERQQFVEQCGAIGYLIVQQFHYARTIIACYYRWHEEHYVDKPFTIALVDEFLDSGTLWDYTAPHYRYNEHLLSAGPSHTSGPESSP